MAGGRDVCPVLQAREPPLPLRGSRFGQPAPGDDQRAGADVPAPFGKQFPGLAPPEPTSLSPDRLDEVLGSLPAARIGLVPAAQSADVLPLIGWTPSDQSSALPVAAVVRSWEDRFGARLLRVRTGMPGTSPTPGGSQPRRLGVNPPGATLPPVGWPAPAVTRQVAKSTVL